MILKFILALVLYTSLTALSVAFIVSIPTWCAPNVGSVNGFAVPMCKALS